jgi:hypothetical protein
MQERGIPESTFVGTPAYCVEMRHSQKPLNCINHRPILSAMSQPALWEQV